MPLRGRAGRAAAAAHGNHTRVPYTFQSHARAGRGAQARRTTQALRMLMHDTGKNASLGSNSARKRKAQALNASLVERPVGPPPPPCPTDPNNPLPAKMRFKSGARQFKCSQPGVRAVSPDNPIPLVWSRELVETQRVFRNENPFETTKFRTFLPQLPASSNMSRIMRHGLCTLALCLHELVACPSARFCTRCT